MLQRFEKIYFKMNGVLPTPAAARVVARPL
jgi:hypothetical protein